MFLLQRTLYFSVRNIYDAFVCFPAIIPITFFTYFNREHGAICLMKFSIPINNVRGAAERVL